MTIGARDYIQQNLEYYKNVNCNTFNSTFNKLIINQLERRIFQLVYLVEITLSQSHVIHSLSNESFKERTIAICSVERWLMYLKLLGDSEPLLLLSGSLDFKAFIAKYNPSKLSMT